MNLSKSGRDIAVTGAALFVAGLLQGGVIDHFTNPRMALSAHLTAVQSGTALMVAAALWSATRSTGISEMIARLGMTVGMVGLWVALTLAAITGANDSLPMAGAGFGGSAQAEALVGMLVVVSSVAMTIGWISFAVGLVRGYSRSD